MKPLLSFALVVGLNCLISSALGQGATPWEQCGGSGWAGETICASGSVCTYISYYYSQCIPGGPSNTPISCPVTHTSVSYPYTTITTVNRRTTTGTGTGTATSTGPTVTPTGLPVRFIKDTVSGFHLQEISGQPVLGPGASAGFFSVGSTISVERASTWLYLKVLTVPTSWKPLSFTFGYAGESDWTLVNSTYIAVGATTPPEHTFLACLTSNPLVQNIYLQTGTDTPACGVCSITQLALEIP